MVFNIFSLVRVMRPIAILVTCLAALFAKVNAFDISSPGVPDQQVHAPVNSTQDFMYHDAGYYELVNGTKITDVLHVFTNTTATVLDPETGFVYYNLTSIPANSNNDTTLTKRYATWDYDGFYHSWWQAQAAQQGYWWSPWYPISPCAKFGLSDQGGDIELSWSYTYTWSYDVSIGISWEVISASVDYSISQSLSYSGTLTCNVGAGSVGQAWYQQRVMWADMQKQYCRLNTSGKTVCDAWSQYYRVNAPTNGQTATDRIVGCSTGDANCRCS
uniref:K62 killer preprotoxin n=1 Tax=Saccharomyces paradoxus L-A virus M62 satellite TaxID=2048877 RepID=A0A2D1CHF6_9VIRU|nr:K62 killer preprotoxin [Saccharomyces paradoxus L-A virus M62 satellite]